MRATVVTIDDVTTDGVTTDGVTPDGVTIDGVTIVTNHTLTVMASLVPAIHAPTAPPPYR